MTFLASTRFISAGAKCHVKGPARNGAEWTDINSSLVTSMLCLYMFFLPRCRSHAPFKFGERFQKRLSLLFKYWEVVVRRRANLFEGFFVLSFDGFVFRYLFHAVGCRLVVYIVD